jgi:hypothetical protein
MADRIAPRAVVPVPPPTAATNTVVEQDVRPHYAPDPLPDIWGSLIWALCLALLVAAAVLAWNRYRRERRRPPPPVVIPPYRRALERLRAALDLLHDPERFTVAVSDALRVYLEERFDLHAPERTSEEFLAELRAGSVLTPLQQQLMGDFLTRCDLVKFARYEPREPELRELHDAAVRLVEETEPLLNTPAPAVRAVPQPPA